MPTTSTFAEAAPRPRRKGEITAERILDVAEDLFGERGYEGTTLRDVAGGVGIRTPSLYNHFPNKESLYAAVLERSVGPVMAVLASFVEEGSDARQDSAQLIEGLMALLERHPKLPSLVQHETLAGGRRLTPMLRDWIAPIFAKANEMAQEMPAAERWGSERIPLLVLAMYHIVVGFFTIAPLYKELNGLDLASKRARAAQTRFLIEISEALFSDTGSGR